MKCPSRPESASSPRKKMEMCSVPPTWAVAKLDATLKTSPPKEYVQVKPQSPPSIVTNTLFSYNNNTRAIHNKENASEEHDRISHDPLLVSDNGLEDSGYLSLQNSHIDELRDSQSEENHAAAERSFATPACPPCQRKATASTLSAHKSYPKKTCTQSLGTPSLPARERTTASRAISFSTPVTDDSGSDLPILKFQRAVCKELAKSFQKTKRYDWSLVNKVAEDYVLDRVIGRQMGLDHVDMLTSLLSRNMRKILTHILAQLGDMDLISCKQVSKKWMKIIYEDKEAFKRCTEAEQRLMESKNSRGSNACGLTREATSTRAVLSGMQTLATVQPSSTPGSKASQHIQSSNEKSTRFQEYMKAASTLKQHESLCRCRRCGSPAKHLPEVQRATCTRPSCLFDFCTGCQEAFHGSRPCRAVTPHVPVSGRSSSITIVGSAQSKRNIRRL